MKKLFKWTSITLGSVAGLIVLVVAGVYAVSGSKIGTRYEIEAYPLKVVSDSAAVARGRHISTIRGCFDCHGQNFGGRVFIDDPALGRLVASNLTAGRNGVAGRFTDADWERAIRHGVRPDGSVLLIMPSYEYATLSDEDLAGLVAYFRQLPPVDSDLPPSKVGPLGRALYVAGQIPLVAAEMIDHTAVRPSTVTPGATVEYGQYLATSCTGCHGKALSGGPLPGAPPEAPHAANLTPDPTGLAAWSEADFFRALREGKRPDGSQILDAMPWRGMTSAMSDDEIRALYRYLRTVPPVATVKQNPNVRTVRDA